MKNEPISPGNTICILGGGQLGDMSAVAAQQLGYRVVVWAQKGDNPAFDTAASYLEFPYNSGDGYPFATVIHDARVVTTEFENVPLELTKKLEDWGKIVRPSSRVLEVAQSRCFEKRLASDLGVATAPTIWMPQDVEKSSENLWEYLPGILKTDKLGYDGKGQYHVETTEALSQAHREANTDCVLEKRIDLLCECSVFVARTADGSISVSGVVENVHKDGILDTTAWFAATVPTHLQKQAQEIARVFAEHLELEGVLCLEFFVDQEENLLFNEMAPRPHNSFHGSIECAHTSQFEQHIRAICGLPLGEVAFHTAGVMENYVGYEWEYKWKRDIQRSGTHVHLYRKRQTRPGRKMGHATTLLK